jgi:signal transduction histidine kinase
VTALAEHAARLTDRDGVTIDVQGPKRRLELSHHAETQLFGIGREALANAVKHADAHTAWITLSSEARQVVLEISDDGNGFDPAAGHPGHFGLESMRGRAAEIGGRLTITSAPGHGTVVRAEVPTATDGHVDGT